MNHHYRKGFQTVTKNDPYHIEERLKEVDPYLYIMFNPNTGGHLVMDGYTELAVMKIPQKGFEYLDDRAYWEIRRISPNRGYSAIKEVEERKARREREEQRKLDDLAYDFAKEASPAFKEAFSTGRTEGASTYH